MRPRVEVDSGEPSIVCDFPARPYSYVSKHTDTGFLDSGVNIFYYMFCFETHKKPNCKRRYQLVSAKNASFEKLRRKRKGFITKSH